MRTMGKIIINNPSLVFFFLFCHCVASFDHCLTAILYIFPVSCVCGCCGSSMWLKRWFYSSPSAWAAEVWRHASCLVFHLGSWPLPEVSGHTLDQARPHRVEQPLPITPQCSTKPGWVEMKGLSEATIPLIPVCF